MNIHLHFILTAISLQNEKKTHPQYSVIGIGSISYVNINRVDSRFTCQFAMILLFCLVLSTWAGFKIKTKERINQKVSVLIIKYFNINKNGM